MRTSPPWELPIFRSDLQAKVLTTLFADTSRQKRLSFRDIVNRTRGSRSAVHRELDRLTNAGMIEKELSNGSSSYVAAEASSLYKPLRELLQKTVSVEPELTRRLAGFKSIQHASIFGSWANAKLQPDSDIDLLLVIDDDSAESTAIRDQIRSVQELIDRPIHATWYTQTELKQRQQERDQFLLNILSQARVQLAGEQL